MMYTASIQKRQTKAKRKQISSPLIVEVKLRDIPVHSIKITANELENIRQKAGVPASKLLVP